MLQPPTMVSIMRLAWSRKRWSRPAGVEQEILAVSLRSRNLERVVLLRAAVVVPGDDVVQGKDAAAGSERDGAGQRLVDIGRIDQVHAAGSDVSHTDSDLAYLSLNSEIEMLGIGRLQVRIHAQNVMR